MRIYVLTKIFIYSLEFSKALKAVSAFLKAVKTLSRKQRKLLVHSATVLSS